MTDMGKTLSEQHRARISQSMCGNHNGAKSNIGDIVRGKPSHRLGKTLSYQTKWEIAMHNPNRMPVKATRIATGEVFHFNSIRQAARVLNVHISGVSMCCRGRIRKHKGYYLEYELKMN